MSATNVRWNGVTSGLRSRNWTLPSSPSSVTVAWTLSDGMYSWISDMLAERNRPSSSLMALKYAPRRPPALCVSFRLGLRLSTSPIRLARWTFTAYSFSHLVPIECRARRPRPRDTWAMDPRHPLPPAAIGAHIHTHLHKRHIQLHALSPGDVLHITPP